MAFSAVLAVAVVALSVGVTSAGTQSVRPITGTCWTNGTHWGDTAFPQYTTKLPACWEAICRPQQRDVIIGTPCTLGPDVEYTEGQLKSMYLKHCYPSRRGELPGRECCGGYPVCAHASKTRGQFNNAFFLENLYKILGINKK